MAFCGLGSIGSRHLRNIKQVLEERGEGYSVDWITDSERSIPEEFADTINNRYKYSDKIDSDYDIIFITNPTNLHYETIEKYQWFTKNLFIEKPLFSDDQKKIEHINTKCLFYVACPVRYK